MAKTKLTVGRTIPRVLFNVVVAAFLLSFIGDFLIGLNETLGAIISLAVILFLVPMILQKRPGQETMLSFILAIPAGVAVVTLLNSLFNITLPTLDTATGILSSGFVFLIGAYFLADLTYISIFKKRK